MMPPESPQESSLNASPRWLFIPHSDIWLLHEAVHLGSVIELIYRYNNAPDPAHVFFSFQPETTSRTKEIEAVFDESGAWKIKGCDISDEKWPRATRGACSGVRPVPNALFSHLSLCSFFTSCAPFLLVLCAPRLSSTDALNLSTCATVMIPHAHYQSHFVEPAERPGQPYASKSLASPGSMDWTYISTCATVMNSHDYCQSHSRETRRVPWAPVSPSRPHIL
jgi:hypothetical protein